MRAKLKLASIFILLLAAISVSHARAADIAKPTVDLSIYRHVSSVVWIAKDLDPVVNYWEKLGLDNIQRTEVREFTDLISRGKLAPTTARSAVGHVGGVLIDLPESSPWDWRHFGAIAVDVSNLADQEIWIGLGGC
jgi:hypothetical protein